MRTEAPILTILTLTTDASEYAQSAIESAAAGAYGGRVEHLVVHDGTSAFADRLAAKYPWLRITQGPGRNATAAGVAGIAGAAGEFVIVLNSDDRMVAGAVDALLVASAQNPAVEVWTGGTRIFEVGADGQERTLRLVADPAACALRLENILDDLPLLTARFVRRSVYQRLGGWNERFSACSDREFAIRMALAAVREQSLGVPVSELRLHQNSSTIRYTTGTVPDYLAQHIEIARERMAEPNLSASVRGLFRSWHAREVLRKAYYELGARQLANAARTMASAFASDPLWPGRAWSTVTARHLRRRGVLPITTAA